MNRRLITLVVSIGVSIMAGAQTHADISTVKRHKATWQAHIAAYVDMMQRDYPLARLTDYYKGCFQDHFGPEHAITDTLEASRRLNEELQQIDYHSNTLMTQCGIENRYVRIDLAAVKDSVVTRDWLLHAFTHSTSHISRRDIERWHDEWTDICTAIKAHCSRMGYTIANFDADSATIDHMLANGHYAVSHSPEYRTAYHPHYRIVKIHFVKKLRAKDQRHPARLQNDKRQNSSTMHTH